MPKRKSEETPKKQSPSKKQKAEKTKSWFLEHAPVEEAQLGDQKFSVTPKVFSTGSIGWGFSGKIALPYRGKQLICQLTLNCTVNNSKTWEDDGDLKEQSHSDLKAPVADGEEISTTKSTFMAKAEDLPFKFGKANVSVTPKTFSTGACGWHYSGRTSVPMDGESLVSQLAFNATVINSKKWEEKGDDDDDDEEEEEDDEEGDDQEDEEEDEDDEEDGEGQEEVKENED